LLLFFFLNSCQKRQSNANDIAFFKGHIPDTISVMEYNVENLFDMVDNGTEYPEYKPGAFNWTRSTFQVKIDNIASVIAAINADIAVVVEIENENAVNELQKVLREKGCPYKYRALGDKPNKTTTIPVILSRFPVFGITGYATPLNDKNDISRNILEANVFLGNDTLKVFACHWPSKKEQESARLAVAGLLKKRLALLSSSVHYVIAGDFNENYDECVDFRTMGLDDTHGQTGINSVLGTAIAKAGSGEYVTKKNIGALAGLRHFDPWFDITEDKRASEMFRHKNNSPDHILIPPSLLDSSRLSYVDCSFRVFTWDGRLLMNGEPYRWQMRFENKQKYHRAQGYSDHLPIILSLRKGPFCPNDTNAQPIVRGKNTASRGIIGFETGREGWVSSVRNIKLSRDTSKAHGGAYCLKIAGEAGKQNGCAARAVIPFKISNDSSAHFYSMSIRGRGTLSFRIRTSPAEKWTYYTGGDFKPAKGGKFTYYDFEHWKDLSLPVTLSASKIKEIQVEIRVKKETPIEAWIDDIAVK
jgi:endonuclease/exonuclease/phosphatase family metal-dependent hydrolase